MNSQQPKTIQFFLQQGEPRGVRIAEITALVTQAVTILWVRSRYNGIVLSTVAGRLTAPTRAPRRRGFLWRWQPVLGWRTGRHFSQVQASR